MMSDPLSDPAKTQSAKPMDARTRKSRVALHAAFLALVEEKSLEQVTIRDICAQSDVGYTTFFRHFPSKEALLDDIASEEIERLVEKSLRALDAEDSRAGCLSICADVMEHRALWTALLVGGAGAIMRDAYIRTANRVTADRKYQLTDWLPTDLGVVHSCNSIIGILTWWLSQPEPLPVDRVAELMDRLVIQSMIQSGTAK